MKRFETVDAYIEGHPEWHDALVKLRTIVNESGLNETVKWGGPCYTSGGKNVVGLGAFKSYVGIWFYQGALLKDQLGVLINAQEGTTKALRQWRFQSAKEIKAAPIKAYIAEAVENQSKGRMIKADRKKPLSIPDELALLFARTPELGICFETLTLSKQREYCEYIATAKRAATKSSRIEKITPMILKKQGLNDKYR